MNQRMLNLANVLIGKSIVEALLVGLLAISFFFQTFPPSYRGWGEATGNGIAGWAVNDERQDERVTVQLFIDGQFVANDIANQSRPDVREAGWADDDWHGYRFELNAIAPGAHEARVYALHTASDRVRQSLQLLGDPIHFQVDAEGRITPTAKQPLSDGK
jgi:hypothetical protein